MKKLIMDIYRALRFFSLTIAFVSTSFGIAIAYMDNKVLQPGHMQWDLLKITMITICGLLIQSGVNLVNDYFEAKYDKKNLSEKRYHFLGMNRTLTEIMIFLSGLACFGAAALLGLGIVYLSSLQVLVIGAIGLLGGYFYTGYPFNYKAKGLGALFSFILMGPLMICGSYLVFSPGFHWKPVLLSFSVGLLIPALLISNELRDYDKDIANGVKTMSVRTSFEFGRKMYIMLVISTYVMSFIFIIVGYLPILSLIIVTTIPSFLKTYKLLSVNKRAFVPATAYCHLFIGMELVFSIFISKYFSI